MVYEQRQDECEGSLNVIGWLLEFYALAISKVMSGWLPTCESVHSWQLYIAAPLGDQVTWSVIPLSNIILILSQPVIALS